MDFCEGLAGVLETVPRTKIKAFGFIDTANKLIIPPKFSDVGCFSEGLVSATLKASGQKGYFDKNGALVFSHRYEESSPFSDGLAAVKKGNKYGYIDKSGKLVISAQFEMAYTFKEGLAVVAVGNNSGYRYQYGVIDKTGTFVVNPQFDSLDSYSDGLAKVMIGAWPKSKSGFIDKNGKYAIRPQYYEAGSFSEGVAWVSFALKLDEQGFAEQRKYGFIDRSGKLVIPAKFDEAGNFSQGLASAAVGRLYGFIDRTGSFVIKPAFEQVQAFKNGVASVSGFEDQFYIDKKGETIWQPEKKTESYSGFTDEEMDLIAEQMVREDIIPNECRVDSGHPKRIFSGVNKLKISPSGITAVEVYGKGCACLGARRCGVWLFLKTVDGYRLLADGGPMDGFSVLKSVTNGYFDLQTTIGEFSGKGVLFIKFKFNGKKYDEVESGCVPKNIC